MKKRVVLITLSSKARMLGDSLVTDILLPNTELHHLPANELIKGHFFEAVYRAVQDEDEQIAGFVFCSGRSSMVKLAQELDRKLLYVHPERRRPVIFTNDSSTRPLFWLGAAVTLCLFAKPEVYISDDDICLAWEYQSKQKSLTNSVI